MPGAGKQTPQMQEHIKELLEAGFDPTTIHRRLKVGRSSIYRMKRCLQLHGTTYMPPELNKKNGRPKVLTAEQELEVRDWLRKPENRTRYLDDLVWLIHDRFGIVCSTTTMSKMKRKWLRVIEYEETGRPLDETTRQSLLETHPDLPVLQQSDAANAANAAAGGGVPYHHQSHFDPQQDADVGAYAYEHPDHHQQLQMQDLQDSYGVGVGVGVMPAPQAVMQAPMHGHHVPLEPQIDSQLEEQIQREIAAEGQR